MYISGWNNLKMFKTYSYFKNFFYRKKYVWKTIKISWSISSKNRWKERINRSQVYTVIRNIVSHKKREDSLESRRYRILFAAELEFSKILVPSLRQNSSNVNLEFAGKLSQLHSLCDQPLGALTSLFYCSDINLCL